MADVTGLPINIERFKPRAAPMRADARFDGVPAPADDRKDAPQTVSYQGVMVPVERDRLEIVMEMGAEPTFPLDRMPPLFRDMVEAAQEHVQAPLNLCAQSVLSGITLAAQGLANVSVPNLPEALPLSLFFLAVAASGERKTALDRVVQRPFGEHESSLTDQYEKDLRRHQDERLIWETERKRILADKKLSKDAKRLQLQVLPEPREPVPPFMRIKEPTFEGIVNLLRKGLLSVGVFTSEGGQFLGGHGMTDDTRMRTMTGLSEFWDSGTAQRIRAAEITRIAGRRVSVSISVQPKIAATLLGNEAARDQGFLARFLVMMPESTIGTRQIRAGKPLEDTRVIRFYRQLRNLIERDQVTREGSSGVELDPPALTFNDDAWKLWEAFSNEVERAAGKNGTYMPIQPTALKMGENVARIAGVLTLFTNEWAEEIDGPHMTAAIEIGRFYLAEALRLLGHEAANPETVAISETAKWLETEWKHDRISVTQIQQLAHGHLRVSAQKVRERVMALCSSGVLILEGRGEVNGKKFREVYRINRGEDA